MSTLHLLKEQGGFVGYHIPGRKKFPKMDLYIGAENIFNFKQENPIIRWEDPFGEYFNIANVWGPIKGREVYLGLRYKL